MRRQFIDQLRLRELINFWKYHTMSNNTECCLETVLLFYLYIKNYIAKHRHPFSVKAIPVIFSSVGVQF